MNSQILEKYGIYPTKIRYLKNVQVIEDNNQNKYVAKQNQKKITNIYEYLISHNFYNFPKVMTEKNEPLEIVQYINDIPQDSAQKIEDMIYLLSVLHNKTTFYKEIDLDKIKKIYEDSIDEYNYLMMYYQNIQGMIEEEIYMSPAHYYFILNISKVYKILELGRTNLENWYQSVIQKQSIRFVLNHNNLSLEHVIENDHLYFISWNKADIGFPSSDLVNLIKSSYDNLDISIVLRQYESKYKLTDDEYFLLISDLCKLKRINFNQNETKKIKEVTRFNQYIQKLDLYFSKQNSSKANNYPQQ